MEVRAFRLYMHQLAALSLRQRARWLPYLDSMLESRSVRGAAALAGIHKSTSFRWRHRFLAWTKADRHWPLGGVTEADETYLLESQKRSRRLDRAPRWRGGIASRPGISRATSHSQR